MSIWKICLNLILDFMLLTRFDFLFLDVVFGLSKIKYVMVGVLVEAAMVDPSKIKYERSSNLLVVVGDPAAAVVGYFEAVMVVEDQVRGSLLFVGTEALMLFLVLIQ